MKNLIKSKPVISYLIITFLITYLLWFSPVVLELATDIKFALLILGGCGPIIGAYIVLLLQSESKIKIHSIKLFLLFFLLAFGAIYLDLYSMGLEGSGEDDFKPRLNEVGLISWILIVLFCFITSLILSNAKNPQLKENFITSALPVKSKVKWYFVGLLLFPILAVLSYAIGQLIGFEVTDYLFKFEPASLLGLLSIIICAGYEEFGWRGLMQKELQKKNSPLIGALIIAFFWNSWHLPMHYNGYYSTGGVMDLIPALAMTIPLAIIFTWLYNKSKYSILAVILLHGLHNSFQGMVGSSFFLFFILMVLFAIFLVIKNKMWKKKDFSGYID